MTDYIKVPGNLTRGMSAEDAEYFKESYKNSAFVLRAINSELSKKLDHLILEAESLTDYNEIAVNHGHRKALRSLMSMLV
jgi:hypothetical protein